MKNKNTKNRTTLYIVLALLGVALIGVLIILNLSFKKALRFNVDGAALPSGTISENINKNPLTDEITESIDLYDFEAMDYLYSQGDSLYLGEDKKKTKIDDSYPLFVNDGTSFYLIDNSSTLIDTGFTKTETYAGMFINDGKSFNPDGTQADAADYYFLKLSNGNFANLVPIEYTRKEVDYTVPANSIVYFAEDYFAYYVYENGALNYHFCPVSDSEFPITIDGNTYTYEELRILLGLYRKMDNDEEETTELNTSVNETETSSPETETIPEDEESSTGEKVTKPKREYPDEEETVTTTQNPTTKATEADTEEETNTTEEVTTTEKATTERETTEWVTRGVMPDELRPDRKQNNTEPTKKKTQAEYVKPEVSLGDLTVGAYRVTGPLTVYDPTRRIDKTKQVQFEVYEVDSKGKESLKFRSFYKTSGDIVLGNGMMEPGKEYHIVGYFTYADDYDEKQVEYILDTNVTMQSFDSVGDIYLTHEAGPSYNNHAEIDNFGYDSESDDEAIYGIAVNSGMTITFKEHGSDSTTTSITLTSAQIKRFKNNEKLILSTLSILKAKSTYDYEISITDYFGNKLSLVNNTGSYTTSNNAPTANISVEKNEIGDVQFKTTVKDVDSAAVLNEAGTGCDVYFVISTYSNGINSAEDLSSENVVYYHKYEDSEYTYTTDNGLIINGSMVTVNNLNLDTQYYAYIYCDYDLLNGEGPVRFKSIGRLSFVSAGLSSLGRVYVNADINNITCDSAAIGLRLDTKSTNSQLVNIIRGIKVSITADGTETADAVIGFDADDKVSGSENYVYEEFMAGNEVGYTAASLNSMTKYNLNLEVTAVYNGVEYTLISNLNQTSFMTLKKDAEVEVTDLVFAGNTLEFDVIVNDPDNAITGNSGEKVVVNLYTNAGVFVKALRIPKNKLQTITIKNLNIETIYQLRFLAVEYNTGYENTTLQTNKILKTVEVTNSLKITGTIKLYELEAKSNDTENYNAITRVNITDENGATISSDPMPYYIRITEDDTVISDEKYYVNNTAGLYTHYYENDAIIGDHTYVYTLYVVIGRKTIELDELTFTSESIIHGFSNAYEMIKLIKADSDGRFVARNDIDYYADKNNVYKNYNSDNTDSVSGSIIVGNFFGEIDFQGYELNDHYIRDDSRIFTNLGSGSKITNVVFNIYMDEAETKIYDEAPLCYRNFGTISNIQVNYMGGPAYDNNIASLIARYNAATGIIENFVVNNIPHTDADDNLSSFCAYQYSGLVSSDNFGIIRNGYVYGADIVLTNSDTKNFDRKVAGIVGHNQTQGEVSNVYSLVNFVVSPADSTGTYSNSKNYGSVAGTSVGSIHNSYSIGIGTVLDNASDRRTSPLVGELKANTHNDLFYYTDTDATFTSAYVKKIGIDTLYDTSWQSNKLGDAFDVSPVEVGYYPHVIMSECMPEQEYISLPDKINSAAVAISQATVQGYDTDEDGNQSAEVKFTFYNPKNYDIMGLELDGISAELDVTTTESEDGYTTIYGTLYNPTKYQSIYDVNKIVCIYNNKSVSISSDYTVYANFFRTVASADDWYNYVVVPAKNGACENVLLTADIDFTGVSSSRIIVTGNFTALLDGDGHTISNIDLQKEYTQTDNYAVRRLFKGDISGGAEVYNLTIMNYKAGGIYEKSGKTYVSYNGGTFGTVYGTVKDVHVVGVDVKSYGYFSAFAVYVKDSGEITNCSVSASDTMGVTLSCEKPTGIRVNACIGTLCAQISNAKISNCFATDIEIEAVNAKGSDGIGGLVGYASQSVIENAYATGSIKARANKIGGIVGRYYCNSSSLICIKNVISKVDILTYTDVAGGIVGLADITQDMITETNNISGIALGDVYGVNPDSTNISHTVGQVTGKNMSFYGSDGQHINGQLDAVIGENETKLVRALISTEDLCGSSAWNTYRKTIGLDNVYQINSDGTIPKLYYKGTNIVMPYQKDISIETVSDYDIDITNISVNTNSKLIVITLDNPNDYEVTGIGIDSLKFTYADAENGLAQTDDVSKAVDYYNGTTKIYLKYTDSQEHFQDSYVLQKVDFKINGSTYEYSTSARVPVTLYREIKSVEDWNKIIDYPEYENYLVTNNIDFSGLSCNTGYCIGRLSCTGKYTISNITLNNEFLIENLNSSLDGLTFENITISSKNLPGVGMVGVSNGVVKDCTFKNCTIKATNQSTEVGIISHQNGGAYSNIVMEDIEMNGTNATGYMGCMAGSVNDICNISDVDLSDITITNGGYYVGGFIGYISNGSVNDITAKDINITATGNWNGQVGGIFGRLGADKNSQAYYARNITLTGTPVRDDDGVITGSSTCITMTGNYKGTGGIAGDIYLSTGVTSENAFSYNTETPSYITVNGIYVKSIGEQFGGAFGYAYSNINYLGIKNTLVEATKPSKNTTNSYYGGGAVGYMQSTMRYSYIEDSYIKSTDHYGIGGMCGIMAGSNIGCRVEDVVINAESTRGTDYGMWGVGGYAGYNISSGTNLDVINTIVDAPTMCYVGGVIGRQGDSVTSSHYITRCYYLASPSETPASGYEAAADSKYYVKGYRGVGGLVGFQYGSNVNYSYSNANVLGTDEVGGITGYYNNGYTVSNNGQKSYGSASMYYNYFAGTVESEGYAGGAVGRTGILKNNLDKTTGATEGSGSRKTGVTGYKNESDFTYGNLIIAASIKGASGETYYYFGDDKTLAGARNYLYEGVKLIDGSTETYAAKSGLSYWTTASNKSPGYLGGDKSSDAKFYTIRLLRATDFGNTKVSGSYNSETSREIGVILYRYLNWGMTYDYNSRVKYNGTYYYYSRTSYFRFRIEGAIDKYNGTTADTSTALPQTRRANSRNYSSDYSILNQERIVSGGLKIPTYTSGSSILTTSAGRTNTYGIAYASDADKLNIEFSSDLLGESYKLYVGDELISEGKILRRVYSFNYAFNENVKLVYGYYNLNNVFVEENTVDYEAKALVNQIMIYGNNYYYIDGDGNIVYGNGSTEDVNSDNTYINLMNGKALDNSGIVYDLTDFSAVTEDESEDQVIPLYRFKYNDSYIDTYGKFSQVTTGDNVVNREAQIFVCDGNMYTISGSINKTPTGNLIYTNDSKSYETILGTDGIIIDLIQGSVSTPEKIAKQGIVEMTDNFSASVPYVMLQYSDGGLACYNYITGSVIFDKQSGEVQSVEDYVAGYFDDTAKSAYANVYTTYAANITASQSLHSSAELNGIVGNTETEETAAVNGTTAVNNSDYTKAATGSGSETPTETASDETTAETASDETTAETTSEEIATTTENASEVTSTETVTARYSTVTEDTYLVSQVANNSNAYMTVYNNETGTYEIVEVDSFLNNQSYVSENDRLQMSNLATVINEKNGYATTEITDNNNRRGIIFVAVIIVGVAVIVLVAGYIVNNRRRYRR